MIQSMTGFGKHVIQLADKKITVEIKSLNSRNLDMNARMPSAYREKELILRQKVAGALLRGKIDLGQYVEITGEETSSQINDGVVRGYMNQLSEIVPGEEIKLLEMALRLPDALKTERGEIDEAEFQAIQQALDAPRFFIYGEDLELEQTIPADTAEALKNKGHSVVTCDSPHGGGQGIVIDWENGVLQGGSDPRKDGHAGGF